MTDSHIVEMSAPDEGLGFRHGSGGHTDEVSAWEAHLVSIGKNFLTSRTMEQLISGSQHNGKWPRFGVRTHEIGPKVYTGSINRPSVRSLFLSSTV